MAESTSRFPMAERQTPSETFNLPSVNLLNLLNNPLLLSHLTPYLPLTSLLSLASTAWAFYTLIHKDYPSIAFRRLDLSTLSPLPVGKFSAEEALQSGAFFQCPIDNMLPACHYYSTPMRRALDALRRTGVLSCVTTLVLDSLRVPAPLLQKIICDKPYNVRILSLRSVRGLSEEGLMQILRYLIRPSRPEGSPKLKGLFYFTPTELSSSLSPGPSYAQGLPRRIEGVTTTAGSHLGQRPASTRTLPSNATWTSGSGTLFRCDTSIGEAWAQILTACQGIIAFDTVVCHHGPGSTIAPQVADISLGPEGCQVCHSAPERPLVFGESPVHRLPLLPPAPLFASTVKAAQSIPPNENAKFYARCTDCMTDRRCVRCNAWWCENCYTPPSRRSFQPTFTAAPQGDIKVYMGFCVQNCLVQELYTGAGEGGMWG